MKTHTSKWHSFVTVSSQVFPAKEESRERLTSLPQAAWEERWWAAIWAKNSKLSTHASPSQSERATPSTSRPVPWRTESRVKLERSWPSTEEDGASTLRRSSRTRRTALKFRFQLTHPTVKSLNWNLTNPEKLSSQERTDLAPAEPEIWTERTFGIKWDSSSVNIKTLKLSSYLCILWMVLH